MTVVRQPGRVRIQHNDFPLPPGTPFGEVLLDDSTNVLLPVRPTGTRHQGHFERQSQGGDVALQVTFCLVSIRFEHHFETRQPLLDLVLI